MLNGPINMYNQKYLKTTIRILEKDLEDLEMWSVYNQDKFNNEVSELKTMILTLKAEIDWEEQEDKDRLLNKFMDWYV
jgi:hypothetical protein